jgi:hypothetical protein
MVQAFCKVKNENKDSSHLVAAATLYGKKVFCFIDDGSAASMIAQSLVKKENVRQCDFEGLTGIGGGYVKPLGCTDVPVNFRGKEYAVECVVVPDKFVPVTREVMLGMDWHQLHFPVKDYRTMSFTLGTKRIYAGQKVAPELAPQNVAPKGVPDALVRKFPKLFGEPTTLPPLRPGLDMELTVRKNPDGTEMRPKETKEKTIRHPVIKEKLKDERVHLLKLGFITPYANPAIPPANAFGVVNPHNDAGERREVLQVTKDIVRIVYDYVTTNDVLELLPSVLPRTDEMVNRVALSLKKGGVATTVDLRTGFHNLRMSPSSAKLTAFYFPGDPMCYYWNVMPMGLKGAPGAMQRLMRQVLTDFIQENSTTNAWVEVYLDDLTIHAPTREEHDQLLKRVLTHLEEQHFHLKPSKCRIGQNSIELLGFHINPQGIAPLNSHVQGIEDFSFPDTVQQWQRFHGMCVFYKKHVARFSDIMKPVASVMGIKKEEVMNPDVIQGEARRRLAVAIKQRDPCLKVAFDEIKDVMINATRTTPHDPTRRLYFIVDASKWAWGAVATHDPTFEKEDPVAWLSGTFKSNEKHWHSSHREIFAIIGSIQRYPEFFAGPVSVLTDSTHLRDWASLDISTERLARWREILAFYGPYLDFTHIQGVKNVVADALSRHVKENNVTWEGKVIPPFQVKLAASAMLRVLGKTARPDGLVAQYKERYGNTGASPVINARAVEALARSISKTHHQEPLGNCEDVENNQDTRNACIGDVVGVLQTLKEQQKSSPAKRVRFSESPSRERPVFGKAESTSTPVVATVEHDASLHSHKDHAYQGHWSKCQECASTATTKPASRAEEKVQVERAVDEKRVMRSTSPIPEHEEYRRDFHRCSGSEDHPTLGLSKCEVLIPRSMQLCQACQLPPVPTNNASAKVLALRNGGYRKITPHAQTTPTAIKTHGRVWCDGRESCLSICVPAKLPVLRNPSSPRSWSKQQSTRPS